MFWILCWMGSASAGIELEALVAPMTNEERLVVLSEQLSEAEGEERMQLYMAKAVLETLAEAGVEDQGVVAAHLVMALSEDTATRAAALAGAQELLAENTAVVVDDSTVVEAWELPIESFTLDVDGEAVPVAAIPAAPVSVSQPDSAALSEYERRKLVMVNLEWQSFGNNNGAWTRERERRSTYLADLDDRSQSELNEFLTKSWAVTLGGGIRLPTWQFRRMVHAPGGFVPLVPYHWLYNRHEAEMWVADYNTDLREELGLDGYDLE